MKPSPARLLSLLAAVLMVPGLCLAQADPDAKPGFYFSAALGPALFEDADVDEFLVPTPGAEVEFDVGMRLDAAGGYRFNPYVALEGQVGFSTAYLDKIKALGREADLDDSRISNVPMLVNVVLQYPTSVGLTPFVGGGAGVSFSIFYADDITFDDGTWVDGADSDAVFAYQGFGGLLYQFNPEMGLGVVYRYFVSQSPHWDVDEVWGTQPVGDIELGDLVTHSVSVIFTMSF